MRLGMILPWRHGGSISALPEIFGTTMNKCIPFNLGKTPQTR
jgi:hypothetical protein